MNVNKVLLVGRLVENPEVRTTPSGQSVCTLRMATNRTWTDKQGQRQTDAEFHSIVLWAKMADIASRYLQKGSIAYIEGRLQTRSWQDQAGVKKYRTEIIAENLQLGPRSEGGSSQGSSEQEQEHRREPSLQEDIPVIEEDEEIDIKDIPF
ncbi:MAG: single-stranded DNA-binding protein [bacterium]|nr:single-stranded DNA-binding protein [bacterium]